ETISGPGRRFQFASTGRTPFMIPLMRSRFRVAEAAVLAIVAIGVAWSALPACGDVIELKTGQKVEGEVLKDSGGEDVVDLGVDIVGIPGSQIKSRQAKGEAAGDDAEAKSEKHEIYNTADLPVRTIKELTLKFGEGVVLVQTPSGLGSGFILDERGHCVTN